MPTISELDQKLSLAVLEAKGQAHRVFKEAGLEGDVQYHEFVTSLAAAFAQDAADYAVTIRRREEGRTHDGYPLKGSDEE